MNRFFGNWRLKLLAFVLTIGLLTAVAFSENPPVLKSVPVGVQYKLPAGLIITNPAHRVNVPVIGLADAVSKLGTTSVGVTLDLSKAKAGPNQTFYARPTIAVPGVNAQGDTVPLVLTIEDLKVVQLDVDVRVTQPSAGIRVVPEKTLASCGNSAERCKVTVSAPASVTDGLKAFVKFDSPIQSTGSLDSPTQAIKFEQNGRPIDLTTLDTVPHPGIDHTTADVHIEATGGTLAKTVSLRANITGSPACGYQLTGVTFAPTAFPQITGPSDAVSKVSSIDLTAVSIAGATANITANQTIAPPDPSVSVSPGSVRVVIAISQAFSCVAPTPTPTKSP